MVGCCVEIKCDFLQFLTFKFIASMAMACRFLAARRGQHGRVSPSEGGSAPDTLVDCHTGWTNSSGCWAAPSSRRSPSSTRPTSREKTGRRP